MPRSQSAYFLDISDWNIIRAVKETLWEPRSIYLPRIDFLNNVGESLKEFNVPIL